MDTPHSPSQGPSTAAPPRKGIGARPALAQLALPLPLAGEGFVSIHTSLFPAGSLPPLRGRVCPAAQHWAQPRDASPPGGGFASTAWPAEEESSLPPRGGGLGRGGQIHPGWSVSAIRDIAPRLPLKSNTHSTPNE